MRMLANEVKLTIRTRNCLIQSITYFYTMKYSQTIGILLCLSLFFFSTQPLVFIESKQWIITGWKTEGTNFGQPGKFLAYIGGMSLLFFALPYLWAKRFNMVLGTLMVAWCFRNFIVLSTCQMGECPQKQWALYGCVIASFGILIMTFLPKITILKSLK